MLDTSLLRNVSDLPKIESQSFVVPDSPPEADIVVDDKEPVETGRFLSMLFGSEYGTGQLDSSKVGCKLFQACTVLTEV